MNKRVIAIRNTDVDQKIAYIYGHGVLVGDVHNDDIGWKNPKIELDNGGVVWGYQCWWGEENAVMERFTGWEFREVKIDE